MERIGGRRQSRGWRSSCKQSGKKRQLKTVFKRFSTFCIMLFFPFLCDLHPTAITIFVFAEPARLKRAICVLYTLNLAAIIQTTGVMPQLSLHVFPVHSSHYSLLSFHIPYYNLRNGSIALTFTWGHSAAFPRSMQTDYFGLFTIKMHQ